MNPNAKNLKEFKELIKRYESVTLEEIEKIWDNQILSYDNNPAEALTGFGSIDTCTFAGQLKMNVMIAYMAGSGSVAVVIMSLLIVQLEWPAFPNDY